MNKIYSRINWKNEPSKNTPINEINLNKVDYAVNEIDNRVIKNDENITKLDEIKATKDEVKNLVKEIQFNEKNGIFTITRKDNTVFTIDTKLEKIAINFDYDADTQQISLTLIDGTIQYIDLSALITEYEFLDTNTVSFFINENGKVSAIVKEGSIEEKHLRPDYLAEIKIESAKAEESAIAADASEKKAKASENAAKASENAAKDSEENAADIATMATSSASTASTKAEEAAASATNAANSAATATQKATAAETSATNAANSASTASSKATAASNSASKASTSEENADTYAKKSQSYASGGTGTRPGENTDNAEYYYNQAKTISESFSGALRPMGTVTFANLPALSNVAEGDMYNVSDQFTTTANFKEGSGHVVPTGSNVYKTADGKWDILAGTPVTGVKGSAESSYRKGNVNITKANIGLGNVENFKAISTMSQKLTDAEKANARTNIDALSAKNPKGSGSLIIGNETSGSTNIQYVLGTHYVVGGYSMAVGDDNIINGNYAVSIGNKNTSENFSASFGESNTANQYAIVAGENNVAKAYQAVFGKYNKGNDNAALIIGNGESNTSRKNIFTVEKTGKVIFNALELSGALPYIDFHFNNSDADYTSRIIEEGKGTLSFYCDNVKFRNANIITTNSYGWINETHDGGWYMMDNEWVRSYNNKKIYTNTIMRADGGFQAVTPVGTEYAVLSPGASIYRLNMGNQYLEVNGAWGINMWASDTRLKENLSPTTVTSALDKINALEFVQFDWKDIEYNKSIPEKDRHKNIGLSANQVQNVIPNAVFEVGEDNIKNINNSEMTIYALKAIQELNDIVKKQAKQIEQLESRLCEFNIKF